MTTSTNQFQFIDDETIQSWIDEAEEAKQRLIRETERLNKLAEDALAEFKLL